MRSVGLRTEPTVRQADAILTRLEEALVARGASVARQGLGLRFRMPPPWRSRAFSGLIAAVTSGRVKVSAGAGERWRVRYDLDFTVLRVLAGLLTVAALVVGFFSWPRLTLVNALIGIWVLLYIGPRYFASRRFDRLVRVSAREVLERRTTPRSVPQQPEQPGQPRS